MQIFSVACLSLVWIVALWCLRGEPGLVWDEPPLVERHLAMSAWVSEATGQSLGRRPAFSRDALDRGWPFCQPAPHEHPPIQAILSWLTKAASSWLIGPLRSIRLATVLGFAVTAAAVYAVVRPRWGAPAGCMAVAFLWFQPRYLADMQLATFDGLAAMMFFLAAMTFLQSCDSGRMAVRFGVVSGLAVMTKATCVLIVPIMAMWALACRMRSAIRPLLVCALLGPLVAVAVHPGWWTRPIAGPVGWARAILDYRQHVPTYYLGTTYDQKEAKTPWHKPFVTWYATTPAGWLALFGSIAGALVIFRKTAMVAANNAGYVTNGQVVAWAVFGCLAAPVAQAVNVLPGHDGMRQLTSIYPFLAVLVGIGVGAVMQRVGSALAGAFWVGALAATISAALSTWQVQPYGLSFYGAQVGGAAGAQRLGFETTYYWDAVDRSVLAWLNENLPVDSRLILFPPPDVRCFEWCKRWGMLRGDVEIVQFDDPYVLRKLAYMTEDRPCFLIFLMREGKYVPTDGTKPALFAAIAKEKARYELIPPSLGVRLVAIFDQADFRRLWPGLEKLLRQQ